MTAVRAALVASVLALAVSAASAAPAAGEPLSPTEVYVRMRAAVNALPVPPYVAFTEQNDSRGPQGALHDRMRIVTRIADGHAFVRAIVDERGARADATPRVVTTVVYPGTNVERIGDFPLADFGLRPRPGGRSGIFEAPGTPEPAPPESSLKAIGAVSAYNLSYRIEDLGDTAIASAPVFHLRLTPVRDPGHNVLREVWVEKTSFLPKRYVAERFVQNGGLSFRYLITVNTALIQSRLVNVDAEGHYEVHRALVIHFSGDGRWSISDVAFPAGPPAWLFDAEQFAAHRGEPIPQL
ncbi:MAG TPA: hypothetical protein VGC96_04615 [Candidatus Elarobacter sp.]|jgi:hypothetical protein